MLLPVLEPDAKGDSNLDVGVLLVMFGDNKAGDGEFETVDEEDDEEVAVAVLKEEFEEFDVDLVEFDGDANDGEVETDRFGLLTFCKLMLIEFTVLLVAVCEFFEALI